MDKLLFGLLLSFILLSNKNFTKAAAMLRLVLCLASISYISAYSSGAPNDGCADLTPRHGALTQNATLSPYKIFVESADLTDRVGNFLYVQNGASIKGKLDKTEFRNRAAFSLW